MDRGHPDRHFPESGVPHARGDGPSESRNKYHPTSRSPRTWGWTEAVHNRNEVRAAFPTHVGMDRQNRPGSGDSARVPHARGDGPGGGLMVNAQAQRSPRTWGWTYRSPCQPSLLLAFPTHVGMDRRGPQLDPATPGVPHARGDGPVQVALEQRSPERSPRTWGWTGVAAIPSQRARAFPTHVGMDRLVEERAAAGGRVPHARGDGPTGPRRRPLAL